MQSVPSFENDEDARDWADAWVAMHSPSPVVLDLARREQGHAKRFLDEYGRLVAQYEVAFTALAQLVEALNFVDKSAWPGHRSLQYVLVAYNLRPFHSALDQAARGRYEESFSLTRGLYETFVRLLFVSCHPQDPYGVLASKPPKGVRRFNLTNFLRDELRLEWEAKYGVMSPFAHSNTYRVGAALRRAGEREGDPERFGLRLDFDSVLAEAALAFLHFILLAHLRFAVERLSGDVAVDARLVALAREAVDLFTYGLVNHPKDYWRMIASDLDFLSALLDTADRGGDWQALVHGRQGG